MITMRKTFNLRTAKGLVSLLAIITLLTPIRGRHLFYLMHFEYYVPFCAITKNKKQRNNHMVIL